MQYINLLTCSFLTTALCLSGNAFTEEAPSAWTKISQDQVESPAKEKMVEYAGKNRLDSVSSRQSNGIKMYKGTWTENGVGHRVSVTAKGELNTLGEDLAPNAVPEKIRKLGQTHFGEGKELTFEKETRLIYQANPVGTKDYFRVTATGRAYTQENEVDANGQRINRTKITVDKIPAPTLAALKKYAGDNQITKAFTKNEGGENTYGIEWTQNGKSHSAVVLENGMLIKTEESLTEDLLPEIVKMANKKHFTKGEKLEYEKEYVTIYDIRPPEAIGNEKGHFRLSLTGKKVEVDLSQETVK